MAASTGGCMCGAIRYECNADPIAKAYCYCRDCQRAMNIWTDSAPPWAYLDASLPKFPKNPPM
jgi:hypothetical protein